MKREWFIFFKL